MNIVLVGMPASGKSTVGVILAKWLGMDFIDTDLLIQKQTGCLLKDIIKEKGLEAFLQIEEEVLSTLCADNAIIATGGSAVYSEKGMAHLSSIGHILYLKVELSELLKRLSDPRERGVVLKKGQSLEALFEERRKLYERYGTLVVDETGKSLEETALLALFVIRESLSGN